MSAWPGKYVIGLTGNIATGKSVIRKMLEHLGAYGIDADALGHRAIAKGAPGYDQVVNTFGRWILAEDGQIERSKLAKIVFDDPEALIRLESIVHPLVSQAVDLLIRRSRHKVIVVEAIKLLESGLRAKCDTLWVAHAPERVQLSRLVQKRGMNEAAGRQRITAQPSQLAKVNAADVVIHNDGTFENTWQQVLEAWNKLFPALEEQGAVPAAAGALTVHRAGPRQAAEISEFINRNSNGARQYTKNDIMEAFGEKAYLLLKQEKELVGVVGWQVENLVARTGDIYLSKNTPLNEAMRALTDEIERESRALQCEVSLLFLTKGMAEKQEIWQSLGYQHRTVQSLGVRAWQEAAAETLTSETTLLFKQLRKDRVLRPV